MSLSYLKKIAARFNRKEISNEILLNPKFEVCSGSHKPCFHHYGRGGLLKHTTEVVKLCLSARRMYPKELNDEVLFFSALFHDYGKIWDYELEGSEAGLVNFRGKWVHPWKVKEHKFKIHHISRSAIEFNKICAKNGYKDSDKFVFDVTHAILAHHGQREWGSPVKPATKEAWVLHLADGISARMSDCGLSKMDI